jgi:FMN phosphatase YigB (HAD superfamily)
MRPGALLLDFGGVLADALAVRTPPPELVLRVYNLLHGRLTPGRIQRSLTEGAAAWARWRDEDWPDELPQAEVWERFVIAGWPAFDQMIWAATDEIGIAPSTCWFVGDSRRRDVLCARRADVARAVLMPSARTAGEDPAAWPEPDDVVEDGHGLAALVAQAC